MFPPLIPFEMASFSAARVGARRHYRCVPRVISDLFGSLEITNSRYAEVLKSKDQRQPALVAQISQHDHFVTLLAQGSVALCEALRPDY